MKRSDMHVGQKVAYRFPRYSSEGRYPRYAEATILDPDWDAKAAGRKHDGADVHGSGRILFDVHGYERRYRAEHDGRAFTDWDTFVAEHIDGHLRYHQKIRHAREGLLFEAAVVSHVDFVSDGTEPPHWEARTYAEGFAWRVEQVVKLGGHYHTMPTDPALAGARVDPTHLFGAEWIAAQRQVEGKRASDAAAVKSRKAKATEAAERLGLGVDRVSVANSMQWTGGKWNHVLLADDEVLVAVPVRVLVELLDRAVSDPAWYARMVAEGVLDALAP